MRRDLAEDLEKCVRCGSCKAQCPTYALEKVEPMSARGRMVLLHGFFQGGLRPTPLLVERIYSCLMCGRCEDSCPVGVRITEAIYGGRRSLRGHDPARRRLRGVLRFVFKRPGLCFRAAGALRPLIPYLIKKVGVPFEVSFPKEPLKSGVKLFKPEKPKGRVAVFTGCAVNYLYPHLGASLVSVLYKAGYEVVLPGGEVCCGSPLRAMGLEEDARGLAERNLEAFSRLKAEAVVSLCPTCTLSLRGHYAGPAGSGLENAMDVMEFLPGKVEPRPEPGSGKAAYHDPCHLSHGLGVRIKPRRMLEALGYEIVPTEGGCCGFSLGLTHPGISEGLLEALSADYARAETVIASCPGCIAQLSRRHPNVIHIIEALDR